MRFLFVIFVAILSFAAGVWYMGGFDSIPEVPRVNDTQPGSSTLTAVIPSTPAVYENADEDLIVITAPKPGARVPGSFMVSGRARGNWFFEASFPVDVYDSEGNLLLQTFMQADGEWMTTEFVSFSDTVVVPDYVGEAILILRKDNPSDLPENDGSVTLPITILAQ